MTQINIRIDGDSDEILSFLAKLRKVLKTTIAKEFMIEGMNQSLLPALISLYRQGTLPLKKLIQLSHLSPHEVFQKLAETDVEPPIPARVEEYSKSIKDHLVEAHRTGSIQFKTPPPPPEAKTH